VSPARRRRPPRLRRAAAALLVAAAALGGCASLAAPSLDLVVEDRTHGRMLHREAVRAGDTFILSYVHSSEHVAVRGMFRVEADGSLTVVETAFAGFGPGLPALKPGDDWAIRDGMIVAREPGVQLPDLTVRILPITRHQLSTPARSRLDLSAAMREGGAVEISVRRGLACRGL
jgi:hypothetical protein